LSDTLDVRDLIQAALDARQEADARPEAPPESLPHRRRYERLRRELGVELDLVSNARQPFRRGPSHLDGLSELLRHTLRSLRTHVNPFAGYYEAPPPVNEAYQRHVEPLRDASGDPAALDRALMDMAVDLLTRLEPEAARRTTTVEALRSPDPTDEPGQPDEPREPDQPEGS
jgi:hypothetical protein